MPKVNSLDPFADHKRSTAAWITAGIALCGLTQKEVSERTGMAETTIRYRIRNPDTLKQIERWELIKVIGSPQKVAEAILKGET